MLKIRKVIKLNKILIVIEKTWKRAKNEKFEKFNKYLKRFWRKEKLNELNKTVSFEKEIIFMNNIIIHNRNIFEDEWEIYKNKLIRFIKGRPNNLENYVE